MRESVREVILELEEEASRAGIRLDDSFILAIANFARHIGISSLDDDELEYLLWELGSDAIARTKADEAVRSTEFIEAMEARTCPDPFGCSTLAARMLKHPVPVEDFDPRLLKDDHPELGFGGMQPPTLNKEF